MIVVSDFKMLEQHPALTTLLAKPAPKPRAWTEEDAAVFRDRIAGGPWRLSLYVEALISAFPLGPRRRDKVDEALKVLLDLTITGPFRSEEGKRIHLCAIARLRELIEGGAL